MKLRFKAKLVGSGSVVRVPEFEVDLTAPGASA